MNKLIVTADIHGSTRTWLTLKELLNKADGLVVAGDLFDNRYGNYSDPDFKPDFIKEQVKALSHIFYYVYGNCDVPSFFPGYETHLTFSAFGKKIFLHHGHCPVSWPDDTDVVIQGHTHLSFLERDQNTIFLNPGSVSSPRNGLYTYGAIDQSGVSLVQLTTGKKIVSVSF